VSGNGQVAISWTAGSNNGAAITDYIIEYKLASSSSWMALYEKKWFLFVIITTATLYTHYFALLLIASQITYIVWTKREDIRLFAQSVIASLLLFIPWLPTLHNQIQTAGNLISVWPDWKTVSGVPFLKFPFLLLAKFTVGMTSPPRLLYGLTVLIIGSIFIITTLAISKKKKNGYILLFCYFFVPVIVAWISGLWISANGPWRLLFVLPAFYGIIAVGLQKSVRNVLIALLVCLNLFFSLYYLFLPKNHRENWRQAIKYSDEQIEKRGVIALSEYIGPWSPMVWYSKNPQKYIGVSSSLPITKESIKKQLSPQLLTTRFAREARRADYYLLYTYLYPLSDPSRLADSYLKANGYKVAEEKDFKGVGIIQVYLK
jgi:hypothetical protein